MRHTTEAHVSARPIQKFNSEPAQRTKFRNTHWLAGMALMVSTLAIIAVQSMAAAHAMRHRKRGIRMVELRFQFFRPKPLQYDILVGVSSRHRCAFPPVFLGTWHTHPFRPCPFLRRHRRILQLLCHCRHRCHPVVRLGPICPQSNSSASEPRWWPISIPVRGAAMVASDPSSGIVLLSPPLSLGAVHRFRFHRDGPLLVQANVSGH